MRKPSIRIVAGIAAAMMSLAIVQPVSAHYVHPFGPFTVALGWVNEPAYVGFDNAVQVIVKQGDTPYTNITDKDLTVVVSLGNQKMDSQPLVPTADPDTGLGIPGEYEMHFIPSVPGNYTFHIHGAINGTPVDESITASPSTFDEVKDPTEVEFPAKVPTNSELAQRLDKLTPRIDAVQASAKQASSSADGDATHAIVVGVVALVVALVAVLLAVFRGRRPASD